MIFELHTSMNHIVEGVQILNLFLYLEPKRITASYAINKLSDIPTMILIEIVELIIYKNRTSHFLSNLKNIQSINLD